ncbi:P-loop containing nucleoside triphosphate hydrolase protein [Dendrothele bispora CBS 962.96]|uniref:DNA 3'-5' helicase n=1 Tax=Dendrothele bispora (strain CBS 962.96) TaxID=1314807 RepID=A0A4S8LH63_DENBC|nr:P-loop containing nucleoside triphosphate hydrolase protein [Dendrothele bispora CBS 962.96]
MTRNDNWKSELGLETLKKVVSRCIPQWTDGLRDWQLDSVSTLLSRQHLFTIAATGEGKSALYIIPILVHLEIARNPEEYPSFRFRPNPVVIVITPTKALATSIIRELEQFNILGFSYCHQNITEYRTKKINLENLISECNTWNLICIDPEHLSSPEWRRIIEDEVFRSNLILFSIDEIHLIRCLPENVPVAALTATSAVGEPTAALCRSLGLIADNYHLIRRSNERSNMHLVIETYKKTPGGSKYARILDYLRSGRKAVIHVNTIPEAYAIYTYLWDFIPSEFNRLRRMRMFHSLCPDKYNNETFNLIESDPYLQVIIATAGFTQGVNRKKILDSISFGFPSTLDDFWQAKGRVGRDPASLCRGIAIISPKLLKSAADVVKMHKDPTYTIKSKNSQSNNIKTFETLAIEKALFLVEPTCRIANANIYYVLADQSTVTCAPSDMSRHMIFLPPSSVHHYLGFQRLLPQQDYLRSENPQNTLA